MARLKTAVLLSGRGTNLQALIDECADPGGPAEIVLVVSNVPGAAGLDRAEAAGIETAVIDHKQYDDRKSFEQAVHDRLNADGIELVCLAGFMRLLTEGFVEKWLNRMINIHPSLLPAYKGLDTHARVIADRVSYTGSTVHFVRAAMDDGPIIVQEVVPVQTKDDADTLAARVLQAEHRIYPLAVRLIADGRIKVENDTVILDGAKAPNGILINPKDK